MSEDPPEDDVEELPESVRERATTLTRRARRTPDDAERRAYREERAALLADHGFAARVREDDDATLVLHPEEWLSEGVVQLDRVEDTDRAVEVSLSGSHDDADWDVVEAHNRIVAERVAAEHGELHGATAHAFADFASNHYAKPIEATTPAELEEFRTEYFPRNAWPSDEQREALERSIELTVETAESV